MKINSKNEIHDFLFQTYMSKLINTEISSVYLAELVNEQLKSLKKLSQL